MKAEKLRNIKIIILSFCVLGTMALIFYFSSQPVEQSDGLSTAIAAAILSWVRPGIDLTANSPLLESIDHIARKTAHFFLYSLLGFNLSYLFIQIKNGRGPLLYSLPIGLFYAMSDEFHQIFVSGRGPLWQDVILDFCGVIAGGFAAALLHKLLLYSARGHVS